MISAHTPTSGKKPFGNAPEEGFTLYPDGLPAEARGGFDGRL